MRDSSNQARTPAVSIILPTYNRAKFLPQALESIRGQTFEDWELIVIDDGSSDGTGELLPAVTTGMPQPVRYVYQENGGAYAARNTGLDLARGKYLAFFDSDDCWLPHHLQDCVEALEANPDVDWVYGACRIVDHATGRVTAPSHFYEGEQPRPFLRLRTRPAGKLRVIEDEGATCCMIAHGMFCGLQHSVMRCEVFDGQRFRTHFRNEAEDQLIVVRALKAGRRFAYTENVHLIYNEHDQNSSAAGSDRRLEKLLPVLLGLVRGYEELGTELALTPAEQRALRQRLLHEYFWVIGYALYWQHGQRANAMSMFRKGLRAWPWSRGCWKTYFVALLKSLLPHRCPVPVTGHPEVTR